MAENELLPLIFTGTMQRVKKEVKRNNEKDKIDPYIPKPDLVQAVNLALLLQKPLLVMGEPGCGKSLLAKAIAYELYDENMYDHYEEWPVKSSSKAKEGLYEFDQIRRLRDATTPGTKADINDIKRYINYGPLGKAFMHSTKHENRVVLLIDEIDKADIDFPNDLLNELDRMEFEIREFENEEDDNETLEKKSLVKAKFRPIVIITSNSEKELPDAFLRRCIFHYIDPLDEATLQEIVEGRYYSGQKTSDELLTKSLKTFVNLRTTIKAELLSLGKNISTSEYLDWFQALKHYNDLNKTETKDSKELNELVNEVSKLDPDNLKNIPFNYILLKNINSVLRFNEQPATT